MAGPVRIAILANAAQARREFATTAGAANGFGSKLRGIGSAIKGVFAVAAIAKAGAAVKDFVSESKEAASDLQQSTGAVEAVFGKQAEGIKRVASGAADSFGISKNAYQELASVLGAGLKNQGIKDFAGQTQRVIGLGADLASQFGGSTKDAVEAIGSLMRGEADPIERYGVSIKQSAISAYLAAHGQSKLTGAAKTQAEAQARLALLFDQTRQAQGNFAKESDTIAHKEQVNAAKWTDIKARFGAILLPIYTKLADVIGTVVLPAVERFVGFLEQRGPAALEAVKGFLAGLKGDGTAAQYLDTVRSVLGTVFGVLKDIAAAIVQNWPAIKEALVSALTAIRGGFEALKRFWDAWGPTISTVIGNAFKTAVQIISGALQIISGAIKTFTSIFTGDWRGALQGMSQVASGAWSIIKSVFSNVLEQIHAVVRKFIPGMPATFRQAFEQVRSAVAAKLDALRRAVGEKLDSVRQKVSDLKTKVTGIFDRAGTWLADAGRRIIQGLLDGINERIDYVRTKLRELTDLIPFWKGPRDRDARLLFDAGRLIMGSLVKGFDAGEAGVKSKLGKVTDMIGRQLDGVMAPTLSPKLDLKGASLSDLSSSAGAVTYITVNVDVPIGATKVEVGREVASALKEYARTTGAKVVIG